MHEAAAFYFNEDSLLIYGGYMEEQSKFLEMLEDMKEIARAQDNQLTREEIKDYLGDMELSEEQWQAVYHYLGACRIRVPGYEYVAEDVDRDKAGGSLAKSSSGKQKRKKESSHSGGKKSSAKTGKSKIQMRYQQDLQSLPPDRQNVPLQEIENYLKGDQQYRDQIIESRLYQVVEIAEQYKKYAIPLEELIAEGNLGLLHGMAKAEADREHLVLSEGTVDVPAFLKLLEQEVITAIEQLINQETESKGQEAAMLAKTNLLHESAKYLAEENGKVPTVQELSDYTQVPVEEIRQIMGLSEDAKRVAKSEKKL